MSTLGQAIEMARRAGGWTQGTIAERAGITQAALSRYENDMREPDEESLRRLAEALEVTPSLLRRAGALRGAMAAEAHMRRNKTAPATVWRRLEARLNMHRCHAHQLFDEVSLQADQHIPRFDPFDTLPADAARMARMQWRMPIGPVKSLVAWIEAAGCLIIDEDFDTSHVAGMSQWIEFQPVMMINQSSPTDRQRWTLAHELGHLCLHSGDIPSEMETQADEFAAEFLMPADVIRPQLRNLSLGKLIDLKAQWGVSIQALIQRANGLDLLTRDKQAAFYKQLSARGWRRVEPGSDQLSREIPRLAKAIGQSLREKGLSNDEIAEVAGYSASNHSRNPFLPAESRLRVL